jgi:hypothetical protein
LAIYDRPVLEKSPDYGIRKFVVLLDELNNAIGELLVVDCNGLGLVQWDECTGEEQLVFLLHWQRKAINDASQNLEELADTVVALGLKDEPVEHIIDSLSDERAVDHEFAIDAMEHRLEIFALAWILGVKEVQEAENKGVVHVSLGDLGVCVRRDDIPEQELVDKLEVRPGRVEVGLLLVVGGGARIDRGGRLVQRGGQRAEDVDGDGGDEGLLDVLREAGGRVGVGRGGGRLHVVDELEQRLALGLLLPRVLEGVGEVEERGDEAELADEEPRAVRGRHVAEERERLEERRLRRRRGLLLLVVVGRRLVARRRAGGGRRGRRGRVRRGGRGGRRGAGGVVDGDGGLRAARRRRRRGRGGAAVRRVAPVGGALALAAAALDDLVEHGRRRDRRRRRIDRSIDRSNWVGLGGIWGFGGGGDGVGPAWQGEGRRWWGQPVSGGGGGERRRGGGGMVNSGLVIWGGGGRR